MKVCAANYIKSSRVVMTFILTLMITILFFACAKEPISHSIKCNLDDSSPYPKVLEQTLPLYGVEQSDGMPYYALEEGFISEAFDTQAVGAIETGIAKYWYPQYLATVIIAIDRDQTDALVEGWNDLFASQQEVAFFDTPGNVQMLTAAMSYGLEGEHYSLKKTIDLLTSLYDDGRLITNSFRAPIVICYDYQAVALMQNGRNIEIILPKEGTFTYEKGLLSNESLSFEGNVANSLLEAKLRLLNGKSDSSAYPDETAYASAVRVADYKYFAKITQNASPLFERNVLNSKLYMSIDNQEHLNFALIYIVIVTIWMAAVLRRSMQKGIAYAAFFTGIILNGWTLVRLIKYQVVEVPILTRYLWYSFYLFQLLLPLVLLWMAWAIDKPENEIVPPKWWRNMAIIMGSLIVFVFTNDYHGLVFQLDLSRPDWSINYSYGFGYYIVFFVSMMSLVAVFFILLQKSIKNPRKKGFIIPLFIFLMFGIYTYKYIMRDPIVYETDLTIVTGIFTMLMFETCIRSGLIPVNTKYIDLFTRSPLKMQIINQEGEVALASASAVSLSQDLIDKVVESSPEPILQDEDSLLFANPIPGGYAIWQEDVSKLRQLHRDLKQSTQMLTQANALLTEEEKIKRVVNEKNTKKQLMEQLESEIAENIEQLSTMIEKLPHCENHSTETTRIALLLCYIKRRCNLFFQEKEASAINSEELVSYIDELAEIAKYSDVQIATINEIKGNLAVRYATLFYDFFHELTDLAMRTDCPYIIVNLSQESESFSLRLLPSGDIGRFKARPKLIAAIAAAKGNIVIKELEDTIGISLSFPKGGKAYD